MDFAIGVDTGGTHTDFVLAGEGRLVTLKVPSPDGVHWMRPVVASMVIPGGACVSENAGAGRAETSTVYA